MKIFIALLICLFVSAGAVSAQEYKYEEPKGKSAPARKAGEPAKAEGMKCCEGMDKMDEMKSGMPMKGEMTGDMKAKMEKMKATMKEKMAEKMGEKPMALKAPEAKGETSEAPSDEHQH